jgi:hypothetical protein
VAVAVATAIDVGIQTGDVGSALKAGISSVPMTIAGGAVGGAFFGTVTSTAATAFGEATGQAVWYAMVGATGGYGVYQAASHGYYASAGLGAVLTGFGLYQMATGKVTLGAQPVEAGGAQGGDQGEVVQAADRARVPRNSENLEGLDPRFRTKVEAVMMYLEDRGYDPHVPGGSGLRSSADQWAKFSAGVSRIRVGSPHQFGMAADIVDTRWGWGEFRESPWLGRPAYENYWANLRIAVQNEGLVWGGNFGRMGVYNMGWDPAHVEMPNWRALVTY